MRSQKIATSQASEQEMSPETKHDTICQPVQIYLSIYSKQLGAIRGQPLIQYNSIPCEEDYVKVEVEVEVHFQ